LRKKLSPGETVAMLALNTIVMIASVALFYGIVIRGLSVNQTLLAVGLYALLAGAWYVALRRTIGSRRSN
jgi:hypothetical protein